MMRAWKMAGPMKSPRWVWQEIREVHLAWLAMLVGLCLVGFVLILLWQG